jgi:hypothetical protein
MKELIRHILREETYSPAGKEITPNNIVVHKSNPMFRDKILEQGLKVRAGECYKIYVGYGTKCKPAIFATNSTNKRAWFDSQYDDDIWHIDTTKIPEVKWYKDKHFESRSKHIVTFQDIPVDAITLIYEGTGKGDEYIVEGIKPHPKEEEFKQYQDVIDSIVYGIVNEDDLCGYKTEFFLNSGEDALQIVLYYKKGRYPGYDVFSEKRIEIKYTLETYLPIIEMAFVSYDSTRCKETIKENKDKEIERNLKVIRTLLSLVSWDGLCNIWVEYNPTDMEYDIKSKSTASYFGDNDVEQELESLENSLRSMGMRVYIYTPWYVENCEDEVRFLNESKETEPKYLTVIKDIVEPFKNDEGVCDIDMWYDDEDDMYSVYLVFGTEELNGKFTHDGKFFYIRKKIKEVKEAIKSYLPIDNLNVGSYGKPNCGWKPNVSESKEKSTNELIITVLNTLVLPQYKHVICGFELKNVDDESLGNVINYPGVTVTFIGGYGTKMWPQTQAVQKMYDDVLDDIWETVWDYTGISLELYSKYVKDCGKENIYLRESKEEGEKKKSLIKNIRDVGLYDFTKMMGLSLNELQSQVGQIPREMLEQFIKDYVSNEGSQYSSVKPDEKIVSIDVIVGGNAIIDFIYYDGKFLSFEVTEYANGFSKEETDQYIEGSKNYGYNTIFKIVEKIIRKII